MNAVKKTCIMRIIFAILLAAIISLSNIVFSYAENDMAVESMISFEEKTPLDYTLEEYEMLTPQQRDEFFLWFESTEAFEAWMAEAADPMPWELENRNPSEYTWDEYNELTNVQQEAFVASFESVEAFESWMASVYYEDTVLIPWENGGKTPVEYTWEEYESLTMIQQNAFVAWFEDDSGFEAWMEFAKAGNADLAALPWEVSGQKPGDYTWAEYEALTIEQQNAFIEWFDDIPAFEAWMENAQSEELEALGEAILPWKEGGKTPDAYTWVEYKALTNEQQNAFVEWFDGQEAFEAWMEEVNPAANAGLVIPWANDKKQPDEYTREEFEGLTAYQQGRFLIRLWENDQFERWLEDVSIDDHEIEMQADSVDTADAKELMRYTWDEYVQMSSRQRIRFFRGFMSANIFSQWVEISKPDDIIDEMMPWDNTKRQPVDYTWEEYEALPAELQDAFVAWFESAELFEKWMKDVAGLDVLRALGVVDPDADPSTLDIGEGIPAEGSANASGVETDAQEHEEAEDAFPCTGRTLMDRVNVRKECSVESSLVGRVNKQGTEVTVTGIVTEGDTAWYLVNTGEAEGYIRGDLLELVSVEGE